MSLKVTAHHENLHRKQFGNLRSQFLRILSQITRRPFLSHFSPEQEIGATHSVAAKSILILSQKPGKVMFKLINPTTIIYQPDENRVAREFRLPVKLDKQPTCEIIGQFVYFTTAETRFVFSLAGRFVFASTLDLMIPVPHISDIPKEGGD